MSSNRTGILLSILKGLLIAVGTTLAGMLLIALLTVMTRISDSLLVTLNQLLKILAILLGVSAAVGRGGSRGFVTGAVVALIYMMLGYTLYVALGGTHSTALMLGEMLMGAAVGAFAGAILANMHPKKRRR